ncbi:hypothetical protein PR048_012337 [Dryococelus australis]|uniref:Uncharacterized protein n=1 Tax=Dryococelus australis TaxID=614101 RepID=A0ABQ9HP42_9NEOP|nr:hypothetical protein PR048_012337 [Dryococelus australis]
MEGNVVPYIAVKQKVEVSMEQRQNARPAETGDPRENSLTSGIVLHGSQMRGCTRRESSPVHTPKIGSPNHTVRYHWGRGGVVVRLIASHLGEQGSITSGVTLAFSHVEIVPGDAAGRRVFLGISGLHHPLNSAQLHTRPVSHSSVVKTFPHRLLGTLVSAMLLLLVECGTIVYQLVPLSLDHIGSLVDQ